MIHTHYKIRHMHSGEVESVEFNAFHFNIPLNEVTEVDILRSINNWNARSRGKWQYWV
jgi:hypothetical protein